MTSATVLDGTAKPIPELPPPASVAICELSPITWPRPFSSGPPELPGFSEASVWTAFVIEKPFGASMLRPSAETMPAVKLWSRPSGLPSA